MTRKKIVLTVIVIICIATSVLVVVGLHIHTQKSTKRYYECLYIDGRNYARCEVIGSQGCYGHNKLRTKNIHDGIYEDTSVGTLCDYPGGDTYYFNKNGDAT